MDNSEKTIPAWRIQKGKLSPKACMYLVSLRNPKETNVAVGSGVSTGVKAGQLTQDNVGGSSTG